MLLQLGQRHVWCNCIIVQRSLNVATCSAGGYTVGSPTRYRNKILIHQIDITVLQCLLWLGLPRLSPAEWSAVVLGWASLKSQAGRHDGDNDNHNLLASHIAVLATAHMARPVPGRVHAFPRAACIHRACLCETPTLQQSCEIV